MENPILLQLRLIVKKDPKVLQETLDTIAKKISVQDPPLEEKKVAPALPKTTAEIEELLQKSREKRYGANPPLFNFTQSGFSTTNLSNQYSSNNELGSLCTVFPPDIVNLQSTMELGAILASVHEEAAEAEKSRK